VYGEVGLQERTNEVATIEPAAAQPSGRSTETLQTLYRGIQILDVLREEQEGMSVTRSPSGLASRERLPFGC
jgi:hypothetical protein